MKRKNEKKRDFIKDIEEALMSGKTTGEVLAIVQKCISERKAEEAKKLKAELDELKDDIDNIAAMLKAERLRLSQKFAEQNGQIDAALAKLKAVQEVNRILEGK